MQRFRNNRTWWIAFGCCAALTLFWVFASPRFAVPDEPAHSVKAAALWRGQLVGYGTEQVPDEGEGSLFRGGEAVLVRVPFSYTYQTSEIPNCFIYDATKSAQCAPPFEASDAPATWSTWVGKYPPGYYALVGWGSVIDTGAFGFTIMRVASALIGAALLASAFASVAGSTRLRPAVVGVALAAAPVVFFLAGSVNPNGLTACAAICLWASLGALVLDPPRASVPRLAVRVAVSASLLLAARPDSLLWVAGIVAFTFVAFATRPRLHALWESFSVRVAGAVVGGVSLAAVGWLLVVNPLSNNPGEGPRGLGVTRAFTYSLERAWRYWKEMVVTFGWRTTPVPTWVHLLWIGALAGFALWAFLRTTTRHRVVLVLIAAAVVLVPAVLEAAQASRSGFPWQGRYGLALYAGLPILAGFAAMTAQLDSRRDAVLEARDAWFLRVVAGAVGLVQLAGALVALHRYVVGSAGPWWFLGEPGWVPPVSVWILVPWIVVAATAYTAFVAATATTAVGGGPDHDGTALRDTTADDAGRRGAEHALG